MHIGYGFALAVCLVIAADPAAAENPLAHYRGTSRLLVLSAPDAADRRLAEQRAAIDADRAGFGERDLVIIEAIGTDPRANEIRQRLHLPADAFQAVLVGKDGEAKITARDPIPPERLFATIDAMPMRRDEIRRQR